MPSGSICNVHLGLVVLFDVAGTSAIATAPRKMIPSAGSEVRALVTAGSLYIVDAKSEKALGRR